MCDHAYKNKAIVVEKINYDKFSKGMDVGIVHTYMVKHLNGEILQFLLLILY